MAGRSFRQSIVPSYYIDYCRILHRCRGSLILKNCTNEIIWPKSHQAKNNKKLSRYNKGTLYSNIIQVFVKYFLSPLCSDRLAFASLPTYLNLQFFTFSTLIHNKCMHPLFFHTDLKLNATLCGSKNQIILLFTVRNMLKLVWDSINQQLNNEMNIIY